MERYKIIFAYDGTQFVGSQRQAKSRTVQSVLERALGKLGWDGKSVLLAGRTDTGVHASGQVAAVDLNWNHTDDDLRNALNSNLPTDIAVSLVSKVEARFHPRFDARSRHYRYKVVVQSIRDPLRDRLHGGYGQRQMQVFFQKLHHSWSGRTISLLSVLRQVRPAAP